MLLTGVLLTGTHAARPSAATLGDGVLYAENDTGEIFQVQSAAWASWYPPPAGSGTVTSVDSGTGLSGGPITTAGELALADTTVTPATYGDATNVAQLTVDAQGRITDAVDVPIDFPASEQSAEVLYEFDDFVTNQSSAAAYKFPYVVGANPALQTPEANHPGIVRISSSGGNTMNPSNTSGKSLLPVDNFEMVAVLRPNTHASSHYYCGLWGAVALPPTDGIYVEGLTSDTNWFLVCRSGGTQTRVDTGVAITGSTWYKVRLRRIDASTIGCTVNAGSEVTCTTNIPTAGLSPFCGMTATSGTQSVDWDFWSLKNTVTRY